MGENGQNDITKYFQNSSAKKRELGSSSSEANEDPKKLKEGSLGSNDDNVVFETKSTSETKDCNETLEAIKRLELQIKHLFELAHKTNSSQIKGECQLVELKTSVDSISSKFEEFEKDRLEKEQKIQKLEETVTTLNEKVLNLNNQVNDLHKKAEKQEQYSRRNCLLIHGVTEDKNENVDDLVVSIIKNNMDIEIFSDDLCRAHRIGKSNGGAKKGRPIIVKFVRHNIKHNIFRNKKRLKGKNISITESLTKVRMEKLNEARELFGFKNVWTSDGRILYKREGEEGTNLYYD